MFLTASAPLMLASIEGFLFFLVIIGVSALSNWLKKKQQQNEDGAPSPEAGGEGAPSRKSFDWEEELRRLIEGSRPGPETPKPPPAPPVIRPVLEEPDPTRHPPVVERTPVPRRPTPVRQAPVPVPAATTRQPGRGVAESFREELAGRRAAMHHRLGKLQVSWKKRAAEMDAAVAERTAGLKQAAATPATAMTSRTVSGGRRQASPAVRNVLASLRRPSSASEAIIAAEILGQPKGLQM